MRFNCVTPEETSQLYFETFKLYENRITNWHKRFAWVPTRIGKVRVWLEYYERKAIPKNGNTLEIRYYCYWEHPHSLGCYDMEYRLRE